MEVLDQGVNPIFMDPDPDKAREFFRQKSRAMVDKRMTEKEAVEITLAAAAGSVDKSAVAAFFKKHLRIPETRV